MKRNIHELPALREIADRIRASFILVSNVLPYTAELQDEILYNLEPTSYEGQGWPDNPLWILPKMDWNRETQEPLSTIMRQQPNLSFLDINLNQRNNYCPFVQTGSLAVAWHGGVSPCPPLLHSYTCYHQGLEEVLPPLRIRTSAGTVPAGDLVEPGVCGLSRAGAKIRLFSLHGLRRLRRLRRRTRRIASAIPSPSAATACGRAAFCAAHKIGGRLGGDDFGRAGCLPRETDPRRKFGTDI